MSFGSQGPAPTPQYTPPPTTSTRNESEDATLPVAELTLGHYDVSARNTRITLRSNLGGIQYAQVHTYRHVTSTPSQPPTLRGQLYAFTYAPPQTGPVRPVLRFGEGLYRANTVYLWAPAGQATESARKKWALVAQALPNPGVSTYD